MRSPGPSSPPTSWPANCTLTSRSAAVQLDYAAAVADPAAAVPGRAARRPAAPGAPADHRRGNPDPVPGGRRCRGCGAGADGRGADVREAAVGRAPDGPEPGPRSGHQRQKDAGRRNAYVHPFREPSGNAGMIARELPCDEVLASWQHVEQRALDLRAAGTPAPWKSSASAPTSTCCKNAAPASPCLAPARPERRPRPAGHRPGRKRRRRPGLKKKSAAAPAAADAGPSLAALVNITVQWSTLTGQSAAPAEVGGYGIVDAADARDLAAAAARDPRTRWCVTALHPDGTAAAHGCAPGRHSPPGTAACCPRLRARPATRNLAAGLDQPTAHPG